MGSLIEPRASELFSRGFRPYHFIYSSGSKQGKFKLLAQYSFLWLPEKQQNGYKVPPQSADTTFPTTGDLLEGPVMSTMPHSPKMLLECGLRETHTTGTQEASV